MNTRLDLTLQLLRRLIVFLGFVALIALATGLVPGAGDPSAVS